MKLLHNQYHVICTKLHIKKEALPSLASSILICTTQDAVLWHRTLFLLFKTPGISQQGFGISTSQSIRASPLCLVEIILFWQYFSFSFTLWKDTNESLYTGLMVDRGKVIMQTQGLELLMKAGEYVEDNRIVEEKEKKKRSRKFVSGLFCKISPDTQCY